MFLINVESIFCRFDLIKALSNIELGVVLLKETQKGAQPCFGSAVKDTIYGAFSVMVTVTESLQLSASVASSV